MLENKKPITERPAIALLPAKRESSGYLTARGHGVAQVTLEDKVVVVSGRRAEDGDRGLAVALHHLRLDVAERLWEVQMERGLVGVLASVLNLQGQLEAVLTAHEVFHQVPIKSER